VPAQLVNDATHLVNLGTASRWWGTKAANAELQLAQLVGGMRNSKISDGRQRALLRVGIEAIRDEAENAPYMYFFLFFFLRVIRGTHWQIAPSTEPPVVKAENKDGTPGTGDADPPNVPPLGEKPGKGEEKDALGENLERAIRTTEQEALARAHVEGGRLDSVTVPEESKVKAEGEVKSDVKIGDTAVLLEGVEVGPRDARPRFPQVSESNKQIFSNSPDNLIASEAMRNVFVGEWNPFKAEQDVFKDVVEGLKAHLFTEANIREALQGFEKTTDTFPQKMSVKRREQAEEDCLKEAMATGTEFTTVVKAFVKKEVSAKPKPRPIADHGPKRLVPLAKVAWVYEHVVAKMKFSNIKGREKTKALVELFNNFTSLKNTSALVENDLTAFEFGVSEKLKEAELDIINHVASKLNLADIGEATFERVASARTKRATWSMSFSDAAGAKCKVTIKLPRPMRESGDRLTSSGNWLQNVLAWFSFLSAAGGQESVKGTPAFTGSHVQVSILKWVRSAGKNFFYTSARDGKQYLARLAFEGDDTAGSLEEKIPVDDITAFFTRWGWKSKLRCVNQTGDDYLEFVGERALMVDGKPAFTTDGELVAAPPIKRLLAEKDWMTTECSDDEYHGTMARYAIELGHRYASVPPMYAFSRAMFDDHRKHDCSKTSAAWLHDRYMSTGEQVDTSVLTFPQPVCTDERLWRRWADASAGAATDSEWATLCGVLTLEQHGHDLARLMPASWLS